MISLDTKMLENMQTSVFGLEVVWKWQCFELILVHLIMNYRFASTVILDERRIIILFWFFADERIGNTFCVCKDSKSADAVKSQLAAIIRPMYSNPPHHGARIVATILNNPALTAEW